MDRKFRLISILLCFALANAEPEKFAPEIFFLPQHENLQSGQLEGNVLTASSSRSYMQTTRTPQALNDWAASMVRQIPRRTLIDPVWGNAPTSPASTIDAQANTVLDATGKRVQASDEGYKYAQGVVTIPIGLPLVLCLLTIFSWLFFCWFRCCCNWCGGRIATEKYTPQQVNVCRGFLLAFFAITCVIFGFGTSANGAMSESVDDMFSGVDGIVQYAYSYRGSLTDMITFVGNSMDRLTGVRSMIVDPLPPRSKLKNYTSCVNSTFSLFTKKDNLLNATLLLINETRKLDLNAFSYNLVAFDRSVKALPDLPALQAQLVAFNKTLSLLPDIPSVRRRLTFVQNATDEVNRLNVTASLARTRTINNGIDTSKASTKVVTDEAAISVITSITLDQLLVDVSTTPNPPRSVAQVNTSLWALRTQINAMSSPISQSQHATNLIALNSSLAALRVEGLSARILRLDFIRKSLPLAALQQDLRSVQAFQTNATTQIAALIAGVNNASNALNMMPSIAVFTQNVTIITDSVNRINRTLIDNALKALVEFNTSYAGISCVLEIFDTVHRINDSLVALPSDFNSLLDIEKDVRNLLSNQTNVYSYINTNYDALLTLKGVLLNMTNLDSMTQQVIEVNSTFTTLPDLNQVQSDLKSLNNSIYSIPNLTPYLNSLNQLNASLSVPSLDTALNSSAALDLVVASFPSLDSYIATAQNLSSIFSSFQPYLDNAITYLNGANTYTSTGFADPPRAPLTGAIDSLRYVLNHRPSASTLTTSLLLLNATIVATQTPQARAIDDSFTTEVNSLMHDMNSVPSIPSLLTSLNDFETARASQPGFDSLLNDNTLVEFDSALKSLPNLQALSKDVDSAQKQIDSADLNRVENELNQYTQKPDQGAQDSAINGINKMDEFYVQLDSIDDKLKSMNTSRKDMEKAREDLATYNNDYHYNRNLAKLYVDDFDGNRVLFTSVLLFMPMFLAFIAVIGCVLQKPCPLMWMAVCLFGVMVVNFFFVIPHTAVGTPLVDTCKDFDMIVEMGTKGKELNATKYFSGVRPVTGWEVYRYVRYCDQTSDIQKMVDQMKNPDALLAYNDLNITKVVTDVKNEITNKGYTFRQPILDAFDATSTGIQDDARSTIRNLADRLQCGNSNSLSLGLNQVLSGFCDKLAPSTSALILFLFLSALCSCPGICIGVRSYKRLNPQNHFSKEELENLDKEKEEDGENPLDDKKKSDIERPNNPAPHPDMEMQVVKNPLKFAEDGTLIG